MSRTCAEGYTVLTAHTAREAMALAAEHSAQLRLLTTDVIMPEIVSAILREPP